MTSDSKNGSKQTSTVNNSDYANVCFPLKRSKLLLPYELVRKYLLILLLTSTIFLLAGGLEIITIICPLEKTTDPSIFDPYISIKLSRSLFSALFIGLGARGVYLIFHSTKFAYDLRFSISYLLIGIIITLLAMYFMSQLYYFELHPRFMCGTP